MTRKRVYDIFKIIIIIAVIYGWYKLTPYMNPYAVRDIVDASGNLAAIIYILAWTILPIFLFPVFAIALPGGMLFGFWEGVLYTTIGVVLNTIIMFLMTRYLFKDQVKTFLLPRLPQSVISRLYIKDQKSLWIFFFILRFLPVVSYNLINYAAGLTEIKFKNQLTSTVVGVMPGIIAYINFGDKMLNPQSKDFIIAIIFVVVIVVASLIVAKVFMPEGEEISDDKEGNDNSTDL